jgi:hypothetical protein
LKWSNNKKVEPVSAQDITSFSRDALLGPAPEGIDVLNRVLFIQSQPLHPSNSMYQSEELNKGSLSLFESVNISIFYLQIISNFVEALLKVAL